MIVWTIRDVLARSPRPGYSCPPAPVSQATVNEWLAQVKQEGIQPILCLLGEDQLPLYDALPDGLVEYYQKNGFQVAHIPERDHQSPPLSKANVQKVVEAFEELPKPVLIHCSAGIDRTGWAVMVLKDKVGKGS